MYANNHASTNPVESHLNGIKIEDGDQELEIVITLLDHIHSSFYTKGSHRDVRTIMYQMKQKVLEGCHITFSSIIPLGLNPQK
jgi:RNA polymerase II subunit A-like phosphatase